MKASFAHLPWLSLWFQWEISIWACSSTFAVHRWLQSFSIWVTCVTQEKMQPHRYLAAVTNPWQINSSHRLLGLPLAGFEATLPGRAKSLASPPACLGRGRSQCFVLAHAGEVGKFPLWSWRMEVEDFPRLASVGTPASQICWSSLFLVYI